MEQANKPKAPETKPMTRRKFLPLLAAGTGALLLGCNPPRLTPQPERKYKVESLSNPPSNPQEFFKRVKLPESYQSTQVDLGQGIHVEVRNYSSESIVVDAQILAQVYSLYTKLNLDRDVVWSGSSKQALAVKPIVDGTKIVIHDENPSPWLESAPQAFALTLNPPRDEQPLSPSVSEISLQKIRKQTQGKKDNARLSFAIATEIAQQHAFFSRGLAFQESLNMGFGHLISYLQTTASSSLTLKEQYETYKKEAMNPLTYPHPLTVFSEEFFTQAKQEIAQPLVVWR